VALAEITDVMAAKANPASAAGPLMFRDRMKSMLITSIAIRANFDIVSSCSFGSSPAPDR
jgi:hypothetical protein